MILKSLTRKRSNYKNLLDYMFNDKDSVKGKDIFVLQKNITGNTVKEWETQLKKNETSRIHKRDNNIKMFHEIISFSRRDSLNLTIAKMKAIGKKYLKLRGENIMSVGTIHQNKEHIHLHFCISSVEIYTGRSLRLSKEEFKKLKHELQNYHINKFPEISNSTVNHDKQLQTKKSEKEYQLRKRGGKSERDIIREELEDIFKISESSELFYKHLIKKGYSIYNRNGMQYGIIGKRKIRFQTLGFTRERLNKLDQLNELNNLRNNSEKRINLPKLR